MAMKRKPKPNGQHLTREQRDIIQVGIQNRSNKADIDRTLGKDATTIETNGTYHFVLELTSCLPVIIVRPKI